MYVYTYVILFPNTNLVLTLPKLFKKQKQKSSFIHITLSLQWIVFQIVTFVGWFLASIALALHIEVGLDQALSMPTVSYTLYTLYLSIKLLQSYFHCQLHCLIFHRHLNHHGQPLVYPHHPVILVGSLLSQQKHSPHHHHHHLTGHIFRIIC